MASDKGHDVNIEGDSSKDSPSYEHGVLRDPEMDGLSLYEKKALLVNRELDSHGMGKYQWYIFFLCGFGYLLDLLYAQGAFIFSFPVVPSCECNTFIESHRIATLFSFSLLKKRLTSRSSLAFGLIEPAIQQEFGFGGT